MQISNQRGLFDNNISNKKATQFGALKIDRKVLVSQNDNDYYHDTENLNHLNKIGKELKDTKYYDLYIKKLPGNNGKGWIYEEIVDKKGKNIDKNDKEIYTFVHEPISISHYDNRIIIDADTSDYDENLPTYTDRKFEVSSEKEAETLANNFKNTSKVSYELDKKMDKIDYDDELGYKELSNKQHTARIDNLVSFLNILEASKKYEDQKKEINEKKALNTLNHIDSSVIDIVE